LALRAGVVKCSNDLIHAVVSCFLQTVGDLLVHACLNKLVLVQTETTSDLASYKFQKKAKHHVFIWKALHDVEDSIRNSEPCFISICDHCFYHRHTARAFKYRLVPDLTFVPEAPLRKPTTLGFCHYDYANRCKICKHETKICVVMIEQHIKDAIADLGYPSFALFGKGWLPYLGRTVDEDIQKAKSFYIIENKNNRDETDSDEADSDEVDSDEANYDGNSDSNYMQDDSDSEIDSEQDASSCMEEDPMSDTFDEADTEDYDYENYEHE